MFANLFTRAKTSLVPQELYGSVMTQSRKAVFYTDLCFEDSVTGRFDVLALHMFLFSRRLVREDTYLAKDLNQEVFDTFSINIDIALREIGFGDSGVVRRKKKLIHGFYALVSEFGALLDQDDKVMIEAAVEERFFKPVENSQKLSKNLTKYILQTTEHLDQQLGSDILQGKLNWPEVVS